MADIPPFPATYPAHPRIRKNTASPPPLQSHEIQQVLFGVCKSFLAVIYKQQTNKKNHVHGREAHAV